jgi:glycosyltransferase involved in cell wall biosynthesis
MAEAMALGKPVIATAYAGNMDFMTEENSYLVPYRLVEITEDIGPYERGNVWADPDLTEATRILRRVVEVPEEARQKGERARQHIADNYNYDSVARCLLARLADLNTSPTGDATAPRARS